MFLLRSRIHIRSTNGYEWNEIEQGWDRGQGNDFARNDEKANLPEENERLHGNDDEDPPVYKFIGDGRSIVGKFSYNIGWQHFSSRTR